MISALAKLFPCAFVLGIVGSMLYHQRQDDVRYFIEVWTYRLQDMGILPW